MRINALLWVAIGCLMGGTRTSTLARSRWWPTVLIDSLIGMAGALAVAWFVWPIRESPDPNSIFLLDLVAALIGSLITLGISEVLRRRPY